MANDDARCGVTDETSMEDDSTSVSNEGCAQVQRAANVKSEPLDNANDLLLDEDLRLQIEKSIEMVVNEYSLDADDLMDASFGVEALGSGSEANERLSELEASASTETPSSANVTSSDSVDKSVHLAPKIPNDITVIPLRKGNGGVKSEPRDGHIGAECRTSKSTVVENYSSTNAYLASIANGKHSSLTILPVTTSTSLKTPSVVAGKHNGVGTKNRNNTLEFSLTPDVTIKTVLGNNTPVKYPSYGSCQNSANVCSPKQATYLEQYGGSTSYSHSVRGHENSARPPVPMDPLQGSGGCTLAPNNTPNCVHSKANYPVVSSCPSLPSCTFPSTCSSKCSSTYASSSAPTASQSQALVPYYNPNPGFANYNSYQQSSSPICSPKYPKPAMSALNPCRMSSSPVPAYMRSKEPSYSAPLLCNIISESLAGMIPESPPFKPAPAWPGCNGSFRSPTSPTSMNFPLPSAASSSPAAFPSYANQSNSLMIPMNQAKQPNNQYNNSYRANFGTPFAPNSFQRAQCCFSASQIQCFNAGCAGGSQQQFSIVQHSTRLSNMKSNSMDSVSSLLQYHTYFKKY